MQARIRVRWLVPFALTRAVLLLPLLAGCGGPYLMPTPNLYARGLKDPFGEVPPELQSNKVEVLYLTDRQEEKQSTAANRVYGSGRSRSVAFGVATMEIGGARPGGGEGRQQFERPPLQRQVHRHGTDALHQG